MLEDIVGKAGSRIFQKENAVVKVKGNRVLLK